MQLTILVQRHTASHDHEVKAGFTRSATPNTLPASYLTRQVPTGPPATIARHVLGCFLQFSLAFLLSFFYLGFFFR